MRTLTLVMAGVAIALLTIPQSALAACTITESAPTLTFWYGSHEFYLVVEGCGELNCPFSDYLYEETNNIAGLQRHDYWHDDVCDRDGYADLQIV